MSDQLLQLSAEVLGEVREKVDALVDAHRPHQRMFATRRALPVEARAGVVRLLNQLLADALDLSSQTKQTQWNVKGPQFYALHLLLGELAGEVSAAADRLAGRVAILGGLVRCTARHVATQSRLREYPSELPDSHTHFEALAHRFAGLADHIDAGRAAVIEHGDHETAELLAQLGLTLDRCLWMLEAHMQR